MFSWRRKGFLNKNFVQCFSTTRRDLTEKMYLILEKEFESSFEKNCYGDGKLGVQSIWVIYKVEVAGHSKL